MALPYATENQLKLLEQKTKAELDKKTENVNLTADTLEEMNALVTQGRVGDGQICYCKEDKKLYVLKDRKWEEVGGNIPELVITITSTDDSQTYSFDPSKVDNGVYSLSLTDGTDTLKNIGLGQIFKVENTAFLTGSVNMGRLGIVESTDEYGNLSITNPFIIDEEDVHANSVLTTGNHGKVEWISGGGGTDYFLTYDMGSGSFVFEHPQGYSIDSATLFNKYFIAAPEATDDSGQPVSRDILPCTASDNGKVLSVVNGEAQWATPGGSGSGGTKFDIVQFSDDGVSYTGTITGSNPIILKTDWDFIVPKKYTYIDGLINSCEVIDNNKVTTYSFNNGKYTSQFSFIFYIHFITLTNSTDSIYIQYTTSNPDYKEPLDMTHLKRVLSGKKVLCSGVLGNSAETRARPLYVAGNSQLTVYYVLNSNTDGTISEKSIENYTISDVVTPVD